MRPFNKNFPNVFFDRGRLWTKSDSPQTFFEERIIRQGGFYREWDAKRSKLAAALLKNISQIGIKEDSSVLYLGASHGYTPSFLSDMVSKGHIFAIEFSPVSGRDLVALCEKKKNIAPIIANANHPEEYKDIGKVDIVYQDVSQRNQVEIFLKNCDYFLNSGGFGLLALKAKSIDVTKKPKDVFRTVRAELERHITIVDFRELEPFEKAHGFYVVKKK